MREAVQKRETPKAAAVEAPAPVVTRPVAIQRSPEPKAVESAGSKFRPVVQPMMAQPAAEVASVEASSRVADPMHELPEFDDVEPVAVQASPEAVGPASAVQQAPSRQTAATGALGPQPRPVLQLYCGGTCGCASCGAKSKSRSEEEPGSAPVKRVQAKADPGAARAPPSPDVLQHRLGSGTPIDGSVAARFSSAYGRDLSGVQVHIDSGEASALGAQALTVGNHVAFAPGRYQPGTAQGDQLIGHELAHVVQQSGGTPGVQASGLSYDGYEAQADAASEAAVSGRSAELTPVGPSIQGCGWCPDVGGWIEDRVEDVGDLASDVGGAIVEGAEFVWDNTAGALIDWLKEQFWSLVDNIHPDARRWIEDPIGTLWEEIKEALFSGFDGPIGDFFRLVNEEGLFGAITEIFEGIFEAVSGAVTALLAGDCDGFFAALAPVTDVIEGIFSPAFENAKTIFNAIKDGLSTVINWVKKNIIDLLDFLGGEIWAGIKAVGRAIADAAAWVKDQLDAAWSWIKTELLGLSDAESDDPAVSVWEWIKQQAADVWEDIKEELAGWVEPAKTVVGILLILSPFGPTILAIMYGPRIARWLRDAWRWISNPQRMVEAREFVTQNVLTPLMAFLEESAEAIDGVADELADNLRTFSEPLANLVDAFNASALLAWAAEGVQWFLGHVRAAVTWAVNTLKSVFDSIVRFLRAVWNFVKPILEVLWIVIRIVSNPLQLPVMIASWAWRALPVCIKGHVMRFVLDVLIAFVELLPDLETFSLLWPILKRVVLGYLRRIRGNGDLEALARYSDRIAELMAGPSLDFMLGMCVGIVEGVWDGLVGPFILVYELIATVIPGIINFFADLEQTMDSAWAGMVARGRAIGQEVVDSFWPGIQSMFTGGSFSAGDIFNLFEKVWNAILDGAEYIGSSIAGAALSVLFMPDYQFGNKIGFVAGMIIFEVALAVLTSGGSTVLTALKGPIRVLAEIIVAVNKVMERIFGLILDILPPLKRGMTAVFDFLSNNSVIGPLIARLSSFIDDLVEMAGRGAARAETRAVSEVAETATERAAGHADDIGRHVDEAVPNAPPAHAPAPDAPRPQQPASTVEPPAAARPQEPHAPGGVRNDRLEATRNLHSVDDVSRLSDEAAWIRNNPGAKRGATMDGYLDEIELPNGHVWRRSETGWCRYSDKPNPAPDPATTSLREARAEARRAAILSQVPADELASETGQNYRRYLAQYRDPHHAAASPMTYEEFKQRIGRNYVPTFDAEGRFEWDRSNVETRVRRDRRVPRAFPERVPVGVEPRTDVSLARLGDELIDVMETRQAAGLVPAGDTRNLVTARMTFDVEVGGQRRTFEFHFTENVGGQERRLYFSSGDAAGVAKPIDVGGVPHRGVTVGEFMGGPYTGPHAEMLQTPNPTQSLARQSIALDFGEGAAQGYRHSEVALAEMIEARADEIRRGVEEAIQGDTAMASALRGPPPQRVTLHGIDVNLASDLSVCPNCQRTVARLQGAPPLPNQPDVAARVAAFDEASPPFRDRFHQGMGDMWNKGPHPPPVNVNTTYLREHHTAPDLPSPQPAGPHDPVPADTVNPHGHDPERFRSTPHADLDDVPRGHLPTAGVCMRTLP